MMDSEEVYFSKKSEMVADYLSTFADFREKGRFCDVTIHAGSLSFVVHRMILAARIPYFDAMFRSGRVESTEGQITMKEIEPLALGDLINYAYTGTLKITTSNIFCLLETAMYLLVDDVTDGCFEFVRKRMNPSSVLTVRFYADLLKKSDVMDYADNYIRENFEEVSMSDDFLDLPFATLKNFIARDDLFVISEDIVFQAVMRWVKKSEDDRRVHLPELLHHTRMPLLNHEFLDTQLSTEDLIRSSTECKDIVKAAREYNKLQNQITASSCPPVEERFCKEKHHLKCHKRVGSSMYALCYYAFSPDDSRVMIYYYDPIVNKRFIHLRDLEVLSMNEVRFLVATESKIHLLCETRIGTLDTETQQFSEMEYDGKRHEKAGVAFHHPLVYFFGGAFTPSDDVLSLDLQRGKCEKVGKMLAKRVQPGIASLESSIYVTGGHYGTSKLRSAEKYDVRTGRGTEIGGMLSERFGHGSVALNGKIYVYGGIFFSSGFGRVECGTGEVYDPQTDQWNTLRKKVTVGGRLFSLPYGNKLHIIDFLTKEPIIETEIYDPEENEWVYEKSSPFPSIDYIFRSAVVTNSAASV